MDYEAPQIEDREPVTEPLIGSSSGPRPRRRIVSTGPMDYEAPTIEDRQPVTEPLIGIVAPSRPSTRI